MSQNRNQFKLRDSLYRHQKKTPATIQKENVKKQKIGAAHVRNTTLLLPTGPHYHTTTLSQTRVA